MATTPEGKIQNAICKWLQSQQILFFRVNNMPVFDARLGGYRSMGEFAMKGIPDIVAIFAVGSFCVTVWIEVKSKTGKQSPDQVLFERRMKANNGYYFLVRSLEEAKESYEKAVQDMQKRIQNNTPQ